MDKERIQIWPDNSSLIGQTKCDQLVMSFRVDIAFLAFFECLLGLRFAIDVSQISLTASTISSPLQISYPRHIWHFIAYAI